MKSSSLKQQLGTLCILGTVGVGIFPYALPLSPLGDVQVSSVESAPINGQSDGAVLASLTHESPWTAEHTVCKRGDILLKGN